jgi:TPR repeat protein
MAAQHSPGWCYMHGKGWRKDEVKAAEWFRKAGELGYADAQNNLGACYMNGEGVRKDADRAVEWLRKAAEQRHPQAQEVVLELGLRLSEDTAE